MVRCAFRERKPHPWPRPGYLTILGAESPLSPVDLSLDLTGGEWRSENGQPRWLSRAETEAFRGVLTQLARVVEDREAIRRAVELIGYEIAGGTGVAIVSPSVEQGRDLEG